MSLTKKPRNSQDFFVIPIDAPTIVAPIDNPETTWTPKTEVKCWMWLRLRRWRSELALMIRAGAATLFGDQADCNLVLDAVLLHEEVATSK